MLSSRVLIESSAKVAARPAKLWVPIAAYVVLSIALFPQYRYLIDPDGISYISVAKRYLAGDWREAVNLYWGPLYSWLLTIPLAMHADGTVAMRVVCFAAGVLALFAFRRLMQRFELAPRMARLSFWVAAIMILAFSVRDQPDLLMAAFLLLYFGSILDSRYPESARDGVLCGLFGGLAFLTKSYGFVFFAGHFTLLNALHWWRSARVDRGRVIRNFVLGCAVFAAVAGPWIGVISAKYGRPTIGTTGAYNFRLVGPESKGYPQFLHLIDPAPGAISNWEQPSVDSLPAWSPLTRSGMRHQASLIWGNFKELMFTWQEASLLAIGFLFAYCLLGMSSTGWRIPWQYAVLTMLVYPAGYILITLQDRYLWPTILLLVLIGGVVTEAVAGSAWASGAARKAMIGAFAISFLLMPARMLIGQRGAGRSSYEMSREIRERYPVHGNVAACGDWNDSLYLAYYLDLRFLGDTGMTAQEAASAAAIYPGFGAPVASTSEDAAAELTRHDVNYYFAWDTCLAIPPGVTQREEITGGGLRGLKIYRLK